MIEIIPAILPKSFDELEYELGRLRGVTREVQVDLVHTNVLEGHEAFPFRDEFDFECDVMLGEPQAHMQACTDIGAARIVVHDGDDAHEALQMLQSKRAGDFPIAVGVALESHATADALLQYEELYDFVQVMGIDHIGKQGEPPDPHHQELVLIRELRALYPNLLIQVDGAAAAHVGELVAAGANRLIVGSAIIGANDPQAKYKQLYNEANVSH